jgi:hypothetical protein
MDAMLSRVLLTLPGYELVWKESTEGVKATLHECGEAHSERNKVHTITPAMIDTGVAELATYNWDYDSASDAVRSIYEAIEEARLRTSLGIRR